MLFFPRPARRLLSLALLAVSMRPVGAADGGDGVATRPFAPRSGPRGATLFAEMPAVRTGVVTQNNYADPRMWTDRYQELAYGAIGTGVAVGDYDGDGRPDLFVVSKTEQSRLFRNLGDWKFEDVTERSGIATSDATAKVLSWLKDRTGSEAATVDAEHWRQGATFADINNDGRLDLYVCRFGAPNLLYVNQGDGTFKEEAAARGLAIVDASVVGAFCDYDRDGWLDVYLLTSMLDATKGPKGQPDRLLRNNGDGTFTDVTAQAGISREDAAGHSATWWDFDADGWPDLYVANDYAAPDRLYRNNRDGTFVDVLDRAVPHSPYYSMGADFGDIDNDGRLDFLAADMAASNHEKDQRGMAGSRARAQLEPAGPAAAQYMRNALYLNTGTGHFREAAFLTGVAATDWTWSPRFEDLDNDGRVDLHVTNGMTREYHNADLLQRLMAVENPLESRRVVRTSPVLNETNFAFRNLGDLAFEDVSAAWGLAQRGVSFGSAFADFDGDGDLDLVFGNYQRGATLLRNDSDHGNRVVIALRGTRSNRFGIGATIRLETDAGLQVRQLSVSRGYCSSSEPVAHFGLGESDRIRRITIEWPSGAIQTANELPANRHLTFTEPSSPATAPAEEALPPPSFVAVEQSSLPHAGSRMASTPPPLLGFDPYRAGAAAAVSDGLLGLADGAQVRVFQIAADGALRPAELSAPRSSSAAPVSALLFVETNDDARDDLLIARALPGEAAGSALIPELWLRENDGWRAAPAGTLPDQPLNVSALTAADFDRDGRLDIFLGGRPTNDTYPAPGRSALWTRRGDKFVDVTDALAPGLRECGVVASALWSDVDGDGWIDLLVALEWGGVRLWRNENGARFTDATEATGFAGAGSGWWTSLATADFNEDGRPDYVVGNLGLNTRYRASPAEPALILRGDFGGTSPLLLEAWHDRERVLPWLTRNELASKLPAVARAFPRNDAYARATLPQIVGEERVATARSYPVTELRSGVFLSDADGRFRFAPLPRLAQIAPAQGIVAGDFDGDGHADIYLLQNDFSFAPSVGRADGGLSQFLRGDGSGSFQPVPLAESGLVVTGDAKALVVLDLGRDGRPDFVATRNGDTPLVLRHHRGADGRCVSLRLRGPAGNPHAIGAQITTVGSDGRQRTAEIGAGGGYGSQSDATCFIGYSGSARPAELRVRWPDGRTRTHPFADGAELVIDAPR